MYWIGIGTEVPLLNSQFVPISQVVLKDRFHCIFFSCNQDMHALLKSDQQCGEPVKHPFVAQPTICGLQLLAG